MSANRAFAQFAKEQRGECKYFLGLQYGTCLKGHSMPTTEDELAACPCLDFSAGWGDCRDHSILQDDEIMVQWIETRERARKDVVTP